MFRLVLSSSVRDVYLKRQCLGRFSPASVDADTGAGMTSGANGNAEGGGPELLEPPLLHRHHRRPRLPRGYGETEKQERERDKQERETRIAQPASTSISATQASVFWVCVVKEGAGGSTSARCFGLPCGAGWHSYSFLLPLLTRKGGLFGWTFALGLLLTALARADLRSYLSNNGIS